MQSGAVMMSIQDDNNPTQVSRRRVRSALDISCVRPLDCAALPSPPSVLLAGMRVQWQLVLGALALSLVWCTH
jgi:hypothetical protein